MTNDRPVCATRFSTHSATGAVEQPRQAPTRQRPEGPIDLRCLRETRWQTYDVQMLVPEELTSRALSVPDLSAPRGASNVHDGAVERIIRAGQ